MNEISYNYVIKYLIKNFNPIKLESQLKGRIAYAYPLKETEIKNNNVGSVVKPLPVGLEFLISSNL